MNQQEQQTSRPSCPCRGPKRPKTGRSKLRLLGLVLTAISTALLSSPAVLPPWLLIGATVLAAAGSTATILARPDSGKDDNEVGKQQY